MGGEDGWDKRADLGWHFFEAMAGERQDSCPRGGLDLLIRHLAASECPLARQARRPTATEAATEAALEDEQAKQSRLRQPPQAVGGGELPARGLLGMHIWYFHGSWQRRALGWPAGAPSWSSAAPCSRTTPSHRPQDPPSSEPQLQPLLPILIKRNNESKNINGEIFSPAARLSLGLCVCGVALSLPNFAQPAHVRTLAQQVKTAAPSPHVGGAYSRRRLPLALWRPWIILPKTPRLRFGPFRLVLPVRRVEVQRPAPFRHWQSALQWIHQ